MAERPWVTPEELKEYTEFEEVKNRADSKLKIDISRAESWVINYCNNRFDDPEKYPKIPENVKTAVLLIAEAYAHNAVEQTKVRLKSETFDDYSYTAESSIIDVGKLGVESLLAGIIVNTGLYTINLAVMGFSSTMSLVKTPTIFSMAKTSLGFLGSWYKLALAAVIIAIACAAMLGFLGTRLGLSIRATGDNAAMVRASSINPAFTITVGLCVSGALCALSGGLLAQYQKSCDINVGTGMVTIALASLIIGETLVGKRTMLRRILGVVFGSCLYRFIVAVALRFNVPAAAMKLVSAIIVAVAISMPAIREHFAFEKRRHAARARRTVTNREGQ